MVSNFMDEITEAHISHMCSSPCARDAHHASASPGKRPRLDALQLDALGGYSAPLPLPQQCSGWEAVHCVADLETADFVSIRFDMASNAAGDMHARGTWTTVEEYFQACRGSLEQLLPKRIGLCCSRWNEESAEWELRSHELGLWPGDFLKIPEEVRNTRFRTAATGLEESLQAEKGCTSRKKWTSQLASSVQSVVAALLEVRAPIVVHHGLTDLLQLCDKLVGCSPASSKELGSQLSKLFPLIYDTAVIQEQVDAAVECRYPSLDELYSYLSKQMVGKTYTQIKEFGLYTHRSSSKENGLVFGRGIGAAARDAMCIAEAFLVCMGQKLHGQSALKLNSGTKRFRAEDCLQDDAPGTPKRRKKADISEDLSPRKDFQVKSPLQMAELQATEELLTPSSLKSHHVCQEFGNRVACVGLPSLNLDSHRQRKLVDSGIDLHSLLQQLGAVLDDNGRPVVTRPMVKTIRRTLATMRNKSKAEARDKARVEYYM